jgi:hypothetical membrane protein
MSVTSEHQPGDRGVRAALAGRKRDNPARERDQSGAVRPEGPHAAAPQGRAGRVARAGITVPPAFFAILMLLGFVRPGYDWLSRLGSELSLGKGGWIMITNFIVLGLTELALATVLGRTIGDRASGRVAAGALGVLGAAFVVAGVCVTDPATLLKGASTWHGAVHAFMAAVIFFLATPVAALAVARRARGRRGFARYSLLTAVGTPGLLIATFSIHGLSGLTERVVIAVVLAWLTTLAVQLSRGHLARS